MKHALFFVLLLGTSACRENAEPATGLEDATRPTSVVGEVTAERTAEGIRLANGGNVTIRYVAKNPMWFGLLGACVGNTPCAELAPGQSVVVPASSIHGYVDNAPVLEVIYWPAGAADDAQGHVITVD